MARMLLVLGILFLFTAILFAQAPETLWTRTYGGTNIDDPNWIEPAQDSGYVLCGWTRSFGAGYDDMYVVKINPDGSPVWSNTYGGDDTDWGSDIKRTRDGGYILAGHSASFTGVSMKLELVKITAGGAVVWRHDYGADSVANYGWGVCQTLDGGFIFVGDVYGNTIHGQGWDVYVIKTDESGNVINEYQIVRPSNQYSYRVIATQDSGAIMVRGTGSFWFAKLNSNGDTVWTKSYSGVASCNSIIQLEDGGYAAFGYKDLGYGIEEQFWLMRLNANGDSLWSRFYGGVDPDEGYCVQETYNHGFIMIGNMYPAGQMLNIGIVRTDSLGNQLWTKNVGGPSYEFGYAVQCTPDSGYIILGETHSYGAGESDFYVIRLGPDTLINNAIEPGNNIPTGFSLNQNYPNPFNANTVIEYSTLSKAAIRIDVYDILGRHVATLANDIAEAGVHRVTWDAKEIPSGLYYYKLETDGYSTVKRMLIIK